MEALIPWTLLPLAVVSVVNGICFSWFSVLRRAKNLERYGRPRIGTREWFLLVSSPLRDYWDNPGGRILCCLHLGLFLALTLVLGVWAVHELLTNPYI